MAAEEEDVREETDQLLGLPLTTDDNRGEEPLNTPPAGGGKLVKIKFGNKKKINKPHDTGIKFIKAKKQEKSKLDKYLKK